MPLYAANHATIPVSCLRKLSNAVHTLILEMWLKEYAHTICSVQDVQHIFGRQTYERIRFAVLFSCGLGQRFDKAVFEHRPCQPFDERFVDRHHNSSTIVSQEASRRGRIGRMMDFATDINVWIVVQLLQRNWTLFLENVRLEFCF